MAAKPAHPRRQEAKRALIDALEKGVASGTSRQTIGEIWQAAMRKAASTKL
jgi:hypothetical protein